MRSLLTATALALLFAGCPIAALRQTATPSPSPIADELPCTDQIDEPEIAISLRAPTPLGARESEDLVDVISGRIHRIMRGPCSVTADTAGEVTVDLSPSEYLWFGNSNEPSPPDLAKLLGRTGLVEIVDLQGKSLDPGTVVSTTLSVPISGTRIGGAPVFETLASNPNIITTEEMHDRFGDYDLALKLDEVTRLRLNDFRRHHVGLLVAVVVDHEIFKTIRIPEDASQDLVVAGMTPQELNELVTLVSTLPLPVPLIVVEVTRAG
jgi:hypothetical protein